MLNVPDATPFRALSLDGGGIRGIYTAAFLDRLVSQFARIRRVKTLDLGKGFDLLAGTSTGAILACALGVGSPLHEVIDLYRCHGPKIFRHRIKGRISAIYRAMRGSTYVRTGDKALRDALTGILKTNRMIDVYEKRGIGLSIPAVLMSSHRAWVFKKHVKSGVRDDLYPLVDVCMASTAAPIYRSLGAIKDPGSHDGKRIQVFADGGLWANNPVLVALIDSLLAASPGQPIEIYSLGTCPRPEGEHITREQAHRSMLGWRLGADVGPLSISAQEFAFDNMARLLSNSLTDAGRPVRLLRFPKKDVPAEMMEFLALDDAREEAMTRLIQQACDDADITKSACDDPRNGDGQMVKRLMMSLPTEIKSI
jgi:predicted acylesterase/phospholipase RssA